MYNCLTLIKGVLRGLGGSVGARSPVSGGGLEKGGGGWGGGDVDSSRLLGWTVLRAAL